MIRIPIKLSYAGVITSINDPDDFQPLKQVNRKKNTYIDDLVEGHSYLVLKVAFVITEKNSLEQ